MNLYGKVNANPSVPISADSSFMIDFTSGRLDQYCTRLVAVLVPMSYQVPLFDGDANLPEDFLSHAYAIVARPHGDRRLDWSGVRWTAKRTVNDILMSPGPNLVNSSESNVFIDTDSCLHLKIINMQGKWLCAEVIADTSFGFGTYTFHLASHLPQGVYFLQFITRDGVISPARVVVQH